MKKSIVLLVLLITYTIGYSQSFNDSVIVSISQTNGKILIGGKFTQYKGVSVNRIVRINADSSIDLTFSSGTGFNEPVRAIAIQGNGKILVGGSFTVYNGSVGTGITRLNENGSRDYSFDCGLGINHESASMVTAIVVNDNGDIAVSGTFTNYNGVDNNGHVLLDSMGGLYITTSLIYESIQMKSSKGTEFVTDPALYSQYIIYNNTGTTVSNLTTNGFYHVIIGNNVKHIYYHNEN